ncbi:MAG: alanine racemase [Bacteroidota bacterium]
MSNYQRHYRSEARISRVALRNNARIMRNQAGEQVLQMAVVKANAYGHGAVQVAQTLQDVTDWLAVATVHEGIELRQGGIDLPILVLGAPHPATVDFYLDFDLTPTVSAREQLSLLKPGMSFHINIDTGMNRMGIRFDEWTDMREELEGNEAQCRGIFTHFATAEDPDNPVVYRQLQRFRQILESVPDEWLVHVANTGAAAFYDHLEFDMIRTGIGLYGYPPGNTPIGGLVPVLQWFTAIDHIHRVRAGETVSYGATWQADEDCWVGTLPVGYADGVPRLLSNQFRVRIGDRLVPSVGTVTMDYIMINLGQTPEEIGTEVEILGNTSNTAIDWAEKCSTICYEILTGINDRVARTYIED